MGKAQLGVVQDCIKAGVVVSSAVWLIRAVARLTTVLVVSRILEAGWL